MRKCSGRIPNRHVLQVSLRVDRKTRAEIKNPKRSRLIKAHGGLLVANRFQVAIRKTSTLYLQPSPYPLL